MSSERNRTIFMKRMLTETEKVEIIEHEWAKAREIRK